MSELLRITDDGLYCPAADFHIDPWRPVDRAIVTHAHADHARRGSARYLTVPEGERVLRSRMGAAAHIETASYGEALLVRGVKVSLHPAGHILGSAQVRVEHRGEVWVVSGDYKTLPDKTCAAFEPIACHTFVSESTFGLPVYRWPSEDTVFTEVNEWWRANAEAGKASLLCAYSLGKAQRLLAGVEASIGPIYCHGAVEVCNRDYRETGVGLPHTEPPTADRKPAEYGGSLIVAPPSALGTPWLRRFGDISTGFASGWMLVRGQRRRRAVDRGFVLSDHADWPGLLGAIQATGCERVLVTHGSRRVMVAYLEHLGLQAAPLETCFEGEQDSGDDADLATADDAATNE